MSHNDNQTPNVALLSIQTDDVEGRSPNLFSGSSKNPRSSKKSKSKKLVQSNMDVNQEKHKCKSQAVHKCTFSF